MRTNKGIGRKMREPRLKIFPLRIKDTNTKRYTEQTEECQVLTCRQQEHSRETRSRS